MIVYQDQQFGFYEIFNEQNGTLVRSDDINGNEPAMRSFPELLDVGVMGHCESGTACAIAGIDCYQRGRDRNSAHMTFADFSEIVRQCAGKTFQFALGGAGDPNKHPAFGEMLKLCRQYAIVPNITTSGSNLTDSEIGFIEKYCGAVAVSWYSRLVDGEEYNPKTIETIDRLIDRGCSTNIHFVVSADTIKEATVRLQENIFPPGINAVIFILYKPVGNGKIEKMLSLKDPRLDVFMDAVQNISHPFRIGFDTCFTPLLVQKIGHMAEQSIDACEAATFSMYIDSALNCYPCSFGIELGVSESMRNRSLREIWNGDLFSDFRNRQKIKCTGCNKKYLCRYGCMLALPIDLC
ncbi:MAG: SPASM domain-containing protein [Lachnospiraceae bacterium]|nr:SPASM domain-containing protein [Lachnospiraceae bacterium]